MTATALVKPAPPASLLDMERSPLVGGQRLRDCVALYENHDAVGSGYAIDAYSDGRAAFWSTFKGHNQVALCIRDAANLMHSLQAAIDREIPAHRRVNMETYLGSLVPLNHRAAMELSEAYAGIGLWRDADELEIRRVRELGRAA